ncbi:hypothetical protein NDU88_001545 [Pleurodeles waltl]|uniref:Uncharacterized protein n=1 Tax=Pleurodeles waltl TaxID=8319 RepID=A0AAV7TIL3_PLEWA|nr:hypothetical protein NDU88_001545 [Pleurodeles waltl]
MDRETRTTPHRHRAAERLRADIVAQDVVDVWRWMQLETYAELQPSSSHPKDIWAPLDAFLLQRQDLIVDVSLLRSPLRDERLLGCEELEPRDGFVRVVSPIPVEARSVLEVH